MEHIQSNLAKVDKLIRASRTALLLATCRGHAPSQYQITQAQSALGRIVFLQEDISITKTDYRSTYRNLPSIIKCEYYHP